MLDLCTAEIETSVSETRTLGQPGMFDDISNDEYHKGPGISKSQLDLVAKCPALLPWSKFAPEDPNKKESLNMGSAIHTMLLEPHLFKSEYAIGPADAPRNTKAGKEKWAEFEASVNGRTVLTAEQYRVIKLIHDSAMAHPHAQFLLEEEGHVESSIYWNDPSTGLLCRCRPDKMVGSAIVDVKSTADMAKIIWSMRDYRYDVQDAFYSEGFLNHYGEAPSRFVFLVFSTSVDCGRYPVRLFELSAESKQAGHALMRRDLETIAECERTGIYPGIEMLSIPERRY